MCNEPKMHIQQPCKIAKLLQDGRDVFRFAHFTWTAVFEGIVFQMGITTAIEAGYLVPPEVVEHPIAIDLDSVKVSKG